MSNTLQLGLPLLSAAQAQKHVTVNEAIAKLDAFAQLRLSSFTLREPPSGPLPGQSYYVALDSSGAWAGKSGQIATYSNGGWVFTRPLLGWKAWDEQSESYRTFDGSGWVESALTVKSSGAATSLMTHEFDHVIVPGAINATVSVIPKAAVVIGVTGRVLANIEGAGLTAWRLGVQGSIDRYGTQLGTERNSYILGITGHPVAYYEAASLLLSAESGTLNSGLVRFAVHYMSLSPPRPI